MKLIPIPCPTLYSIVVTDNDKTTRIGIENITDYTQSTSNTFNDQICDI